MLNVILFWKTAKEWEKENPELAKKRENIRDYANVIDLVILWNLEVFNADFLKKWINKNERYEILSEIAKEQRKLLFTDANQKNLLKNNIKKWN